MSAGPSADGDAPHPALFAGEPGGRVPVDRERAVALYPCPAEDLSCGPWWTPGAVCLLLDGAHLVGYQLGCPGCGRVMTIRLASEPSEGFVVLSDPRELGCLSLTPDLIHSRDAAFGCGWRGRILRGHAFPLT